MLFFLTFSTIKRIGVSHLSGSTKSPWLCHRNSNAIVILGTVSSKENIRSYLSLAISGPVPTKLKLKVTQQNLQPTHQSLESIMNFTD